jgi:hypothetical protein
MDGSGKGRLESSATINEETDLWVCLGSMGHTQAGGMRCKVHEVAAVQHGHEVKCLERQEQHGLHDDTGNLAVKENHRPLRPCHGYPEPSCPRQTGYDSGHIP